MSADCLSSQLSVFMILHLAAYFIRIPHLLFLIFFKDSIIKRLVPPYVLSALDSFKSANLSLYLYLCLSFFSCVSDLRQELAVRQKERRPSSSLGKDADRGDAPCPSAANPSIPVTPSKPISSFATPPASSIRRGKWKQQNYCKMLNIHCTYRVVSVFCWR